MTVRNRYTMPHKDVLITKLSIVVACLVVLWFANSLIHAQSEDPDPRNPVSPPADSRACTIPKFVIDGTGSRTNAVPGSADVVAEEKKQEFLSEFGLVNFEDLADFPVIVESESPANKHVNIIVIDDFTTQLAPSNENNQTHGHYVKSIAEKLRDVVQPNGGMDITYIDYGAEADSPTLEAVVNAINKGLPGAAQIPETDDVAHVVVMNASWVLLTCEGDILYDPSDDLIIRYNVPLFYSMLQGFVLLDSNELEQLIVETQELVVEDLYYYEEYGIQVEPNFEPFFRYEYSGYLTLVDYLIGVYNLADGFESPEQYSALSDVISEKISATAAIVNILLPPEMQTYDVQGEQSEYDVDTTLIENALETIDVYENFDSIFDLSEVNEAISATTGESQLSTAVNMQLLAQSLVLNRHFIHDTDRMLLQELYLLLNRPLSNDSVTWTVAAAGNNGNSISSTPSSAPASWGEIVAASGSVADNSQLWPNSQNGQFRAPAALHKIDDNTWVVGTSFSSPMVAVTLGNAIVNGLESQGCSKSSLATIQKDKNYLYWLIYDLFSNGCDENAIAQP